MREETKLQLINLGDALVYHNGEEIYKLGHDDVTYYKDAAIKFLKDRGCLFEELIMED